jgi:hypothetical protein
MGHKLKAKKQNGKGSICKTKNETPFANLKL